AGVAAVIEGLAFPGDAVAQRAHERAQREEHLLALAKGEEPAEGVIAELRRIGGAAGREDRAERVGVGAHERGERSDRRAHRLGRSYMPMPGRVNSARR